MFFFLASKRARPLDASVMRARTLRRSDAADRRERARKPHRLRGRAPRIARRDRALLVRLAMEVAPLAARRPPRILVAAKCALRDGRRGSRALRVRPAVAKKPGSGSALLIAADDRSRRGGGRRSAAIAAEGGPPPRYPRRTPPRPP
jgi:hypothetical protein